LFKVDVPPDSDTNQIVENFKGNNKSAVFLIIGQSNAANYGAKLFLSERNIYAFDKGQILKAKDPLPGASGKKGSIWIPFSEMLLKNQIYDQVLLVNIAEGSSTVSDWALHGEYHQKLIGTLYQLENLGILPDYIVWQQGEEDNLMQTSFDLYKMKLQGIITEINRITNKASIFLSLTSFSPGSRTPVNTGIRRAQKEIILENMNVFSGPDTDKYIGSDFRYDGIHLSEAGMIKIAGDWSKAIINKTKD
jgi:hypothetical protein